MPENVSLQTRQSIGCVVLNKSCSSTCAGDQSRSQWHQQGGAPVGIALEEAQIEAVAILADNVLGARLARGRVRPVFHQLLQPAAWNAAHTSVSRQRVPLP